jgi:hypothetical protein
MTMKMEGEPMKPWAVWRINHKDEPIERVAEADTREELETKYSRRLLPFLAFRRRGTLLQQQAQPAVPKKRQGDLV